MMDEKKKKEVDDAKRSNGQSDQLITDQPLCRCVNSFDEKDDTRHTALHNKQQ